MDEIDYPTEQEIEDVITGKHPRAELILRDAMWRSWFIVPYEQKAIWIAQAIVHDGQSQNAPF